MRKKKHVIGSDLKKVDAYQLGPKDYEEIPELTDEWFAKAQRFEGGKLAPRTLREVLDSLEPIGEPFPEIEDPPPEPFEI